MENGITPICLSGGLSLGIEPGILGTMVQFALQRSFALWTCLEKSSITSHLFGLGVPLDAQPK